MAVGARAERSSATGVNGDESNNAAVSAGAVYLYARNGLSWSQEAYIKVTDKSLRCNEVSNFSKGKQY